jgi:hypothetical protein
MSGINSGFDMERYAIAVDLDGTLAEYHGWKGIDHIGSPIPAMVEKVHKAASAGHQIYIFTARLADESKVDKTSIEKYIWQWLKIHNIPCNGITCIKHKFFKEFWDDRAKGVVPNTGEFLHESLGCDPAYYRDELEVESSLDVQIGGDHYSKLLIQPAEYAEYNNLPSLEGAVIKYITRHQDKNGIQDLEKAKDLINMIIDMRYLEKGKNSLLKRLEGSKK